MTHPKAPTPGPHVAQAETAKGVGLGPREACVVPVRNGVVCPVFPRIVEEVRWQWRRRVFETFNSTASLVWGTLVFEETE